ncbi:hypothetical protein Hdeb2414_s0001g00032041 [Helianthus debilis subsp. tardiflorus]
MWRVKLQLLYGILKGIVYGQKNKSWFFFLAELTESQHRLSMGYRGYGYSYPIRSPIGNFWWCNGCKCQISKVKHHMKNHLFKLLKCLQVVYSCRCYLKIWGLLK